MIAAASLPGVARASANLPLLGGSLPNTPYHWMYEAIERLVALGLIDEALVVPKPYSRKQAARYVARAIERIRAGAVDADGREVIAEPLLERLVAELRPELVRLGVFAPAAGDKPSQFRYGGLLQLEAGIFKVGQGDTRFRENRGGENYADGPQVQAAARGWVELTDHVAASLQPKVVNDRDVLQGQHDRIFLREVTLKLTWANVALEAGRDSLWWGPGYHGTLLLSTHAFPLELIKLGSEEPFRLPWVLKALGQWKVTTFLAHLERERDFSRAKVFGVRLSYLPTSWLELGFSRLTQFDGAGRNQPFPKTVLDAYLREPNQAGQHEVNEQAMLDFRVRVPPVPSLVPFPAGLQLYGELAAEDRWTWLGSRLRPIPRGPGFLVGLYLPQVFTGDSLDLRLEYADTVVGSLERHGSHLWYGHSLYSSGMRQYGFPLGHHMGTDARDWFIRTTRSLTETIQLGVNLNLQRRGLLDAAQETKRETAVDVTWWITNRLQASLGYVYQRLSSPGQITSTTPFVEQFPAGVTSTNHFVWTSLMVQF